MISRVLLRQDGRYPTAKERAEMLAYLATAHARRAALEEVRGVTSAVADEVMVEMRRRYPQFSRYRPQGFDKGHRDLCLLTAMTANAMFLGETDTIDDMFSYWYRSILKAVHLTPQFMADTFDLWLASLKRHLTPESHGLLRHYAEHMATLLSDLPDPAKDEVGERRVPA